MQAAKAYDDASRMRLVRRGLATTGIQYLLFKVLFFNDKKH